MLATQNYIDKTLAFITKKGYVNFDEEFIKTTAKFLGDLLQIDYVLINKYSIDFPGKTETLVVYHKDKFLPNISYELKNTPCENVINKKICAYPTKVQTTFPEDILLVEMNADSYAGIPLWSPTGEPIGLIALVDGSPLKNQKEIETILKIIAIKVEKLLEKINYENKLQLYNKQQIDVLNKAAIVSETDPKGNIIFVNDKFSEISGFTRKELLGKNHRILKSGKQPDSLFKGMWAAISKGKTWQGEICNKRKEGNYYWVLTTIAPFYNNVGKIEKYVTIRFEITKLKELEQNLKERANELKDTNKKLEITYKELELFSYSVSHDLKAPLRALQGFSKNLLDKYGNQLDETGNRWLNYIQDNAKRMDTLITNILTFSKINRSEVKKEQLNMNTIVNRIFIQEKQRYKQTIKFSLKQLPQALGDFSMIELVWQNLIGNALKYSSNNKKIEIVISGVEKETGNHYKITDNGVGFDMRYYNKLFNMFQRLHGDDEFSGTGIGLANIKQIIEKHGGSIWAQSELGKGATFEFTIPK